MFRLEAETALSGIFSIKIDTDGKFISGKLHAAKQLGKGGPSLDPTGTSIRVVRNLSLADFGASAPLIADNGDFTPPQRASSVQK
jgi:hypothetical protein